MTGTGLNPGPATLLQQGFKACLKMSLFLPLSQTPFPNNQTVGYRAREQFVTSMNSLPEGQVSSAPLPFPCPKQLKYIIVFLH